MDAKQYSASRIEQIWTQADHDWLTNHLNQIDKLTQDLYNLRRMAPESARLPELKAA